MLRSVRLLCTAPVLAEGLAQVLSDHGCAVMEDPAAGDAAADVVVVLVRTSHGISEIREARHAAGNAPVVALLDHSDADLTADALAAGATSVIPWDLPSSVTWSAIELAAHGVSTIESTSLAWVVDHGATRSEVTETELAWLAHLETGMTIAALAPLAGYSERSLYRQLNSLYHRLGVHDRSAAIVEARRRGML